MKVLHRLYTGSGLVLVSQGSAQTKVRPIEKGSRKLVLALRFVVACAT